MADKFEVIQLHLPYYLTQEQKSYLIKELEQFPRPIQYYVSWPEDDQLQGDGWTRIEVIDFASSARKKIRAIVLSNTCDIDPKNDRRLPQRITLAPLVRLSAYMELLKKSHLEEQAISQKVTAIKEQRVSAIFYLPRGGKLAEDYIAILDDVHSIPLNVFLDEKEKVKLFTLSQVGFYLFVLKLSVHFCRLHEGVPRFV
jgi:hypothetical protein